MILFNSKPPGRLFQGWPCSTGMIKSVRQPCLPGGHKTAVAAVACALLHDSVSKQGRERKGQGPLPIHFFFTQRKTFPGSSSAVFSLHLIGQNCVTCPVPARDEWNYYYYD